MNESSETQNKYFEIMKTSSNEQNNEIDLPIKKEEIKFIISKNNLGRKRKLSSEKGIHTKYDKDNILRKIKSILIKHLINCINELMFYFLFQIIHYFKNIMVLFKKSFSQ